MTKCLNDLNSISLKKTTKRTVDGDEVDDVLQLGVGDVDANAAEGGAQLAGSHQAAVRVGVEVR